jgi:hypothetical protein
VADFAFGDASGGGFDVSLWVGDADQIEYEYGLWNADVSNSFSNYRELLNLVIKIERIAANGELGEGVELFLFTDNFVAERAYHNGYSRSRTLFDLVFRLRKLQMHMNVFIHIIWVAGTRMIMQGTDGLSRGDLSNGVLGGDSIFQFIPWNGAMRSCRGSNTGRSASWKSCQLEACSTAVFRMEFSCGRLPLLLQMWRWSK